MNQAKHKIAQLRRKQLDGLYKSLDAILKTGTLPTGGWIKDVRGALGMSATQMARLLGVSASAVKQMEASEAALSIELKTLQRLAAAMDCRLIYAIVPEEPGVGLEGQLKARARKVATKFVDRVSHNMALEDQAVTSDERERQIAELTEELVRNLDKRLWEPI